MPDIPYTTNSEPERQQNFHYDALEKSNQYNEQIKSWNEFQNNLKNQKFTLSHDDNNTYEQARNYFGGAGRESQQEVDVQDHSNVKSDNELNATDDAQGTQNADEEASVADPYERRRNTFGGMVIAGLGLAVLGVLFPPLMALAPMAFGLFYGGLAASVGNEFGSKKSATRNRIEKAKSKNKTDAAPSKGKPSQGKKSGPKPKEQPKKAKSNGSQKPPKKDNQKKQKSELEKKLKENEEKLKELEEQTKQNIEDLKTKNEALERENKDLKDKNKPLEEKGKKEKPQKATSESIEARGKEEQEKINGPKDNNKNSSKEVTAGGAAASVSSAEKPNDDVKEMHQNLQDEFDGENNEIKLDALKEESAETASYAPDTPPDTPKGEGAALTNAGREELKKSAEKSNETEKGSGTPVDEGVKGDDSPIPPEDGNLNNKEDELENNELDDEPEEDNKI